MKKMTVEQRDTFLKDTRLGVLTSSDSGGQPISVPVWYDWDGEIARMFTSKTAAKVKRFRNDPSASLLTINHIDEAETWVALDGTIEIKTDGGIELASELAARYWDLEDENQMATLNSWKEAADAFCVLELHPVKIRTYAGD
jgi:PPOX class probable F420-dependent enzyme